MLVSFVFFIDLISIVLPRHAPISFIDMYLTVSKLDFAMVGSTTSR